MPRLELNQVMMCGLVLLCAVLSAAGVCMCVWQDLDDMFGRYGRIMEIRLNRDRFTGRCKGFAFVAMTREEDVDEVGPAGGGGFTIHTWICVRRESCVCSFDRCLCRLVGVAR